MAEHDLEVLDHGIVGKLMILSVPGADEGDVPDCALSGDFEWRH